MNPYVYSRRKKSSGLAEEPAVPSQATAMSLVKSVFSANISSAIAFAVVLLAAGSVASMTAIASAEIGGTLNVLPVVHVAMARSNPQVLGDSTIVPAAAIIDDSSLEAGASIPTVKLSAKAGSFDSSVGRWDYTIFYSGLSASSTGGSITIGTYVVASDLTVFSGKVDVGAILKPSMVYHVTFWVSDGNGGQEAAASIEIKTSKGKASANGLAIITPCLSQGGQSSSTPPALPPVNASSTGASMFCLKTPDGKMICPRPPVCGQMGQFGNSSSTPPGMMPGGHGQNGSSTPPWGGPPQGGKGGSPSSTLSGTISPPSRY